MTTLLIIDDDPNLVELLGEYLQTQGHQVRSAKNGREGLRSLFQEKPDLVLLDVTMPEKDGWQTLERIREISDVPVIMLTARGEEPDILRGFSLGADDYVTKPFSFAQLAARVRAVLGRSQDGPEEFLQAGDLRVDLNNHKVYRGQVLVPLTPTEFKLLVALMKHPGATISPEELVREVWGPQYASEIGHVRRYIWHLRQKIEPDPNQPIYIHNDRGFGYRFKVG
ncbi:MAG: response regulator transcription factor [Anaerolineales bacterium]